MKILLLAILVALPFYYFTKDKTTRPDDRIDSIKLKMGAPNRTKEVKVVDLVADVNSADDELQKDAISDIADDEQSEAGPSMLAANEDEVEVNDIEEGWDAELKEMLDRLEPAESESIYKAYTQEKEAYQAELDSLLSEKNQKTSDESVREIEELVSQLDLKHQDRLKDILGAHYEAVRDGYEAYMESASPEH